ncbi:MAG: long-chain fatty acid--CoA ligase [Armatimonadota bacterium]
MTFRSLPQMFIESCRAHAERDCWLVREGEGYRGIPYAEAERRVASCAARLRLLGVEKGDRIAIMAENSVEWATLDWAILSVGAITVPIYPTLPAHEAGIILRDSEARFAFGGSEKLCALLGREECESRVLPMSGITPSSPWSGVGREGFDQRVDLEAWRERALKTNADDVASLIYTSGTTGEPKGVVLTHRAFSFLCDAIVEQLPVDATDRFCSFLPLSHVYERMAGHFLPVSCGASIAYARSPKTLADDIRAAAPTILLTVPRFLESVKSRIEASAGHGLRKWLFDKTVALGRTRLENNLNPTGLLGLVLDRLVGKKVRARLGGRVRFLVSGGAALPPELAEFYGAFGILILQGYGLTETAPVISVNYPDRSVYRSAGEVLEGIEVRIAEDGEILVRGPSLMDGYFNKPDATKEAIDEEGWFHTGDIGYLEGRRIFITDRKKDIIVLLNGKNVSPAKIEGILKTQASIAECMVVGDGSDHVSALIIPRVEFFAAEAKEHGISLNDRQAFVSAPFVQKRVREDVARANQSLPDFEKVKAFRLIPDEWTIEGGELTPSMKVKRRVVRERYADLIAEMR